MPQVLVAGCSGPQHFAGLSITIAVQVAMPLAQQLLGALIGADLTAAIAATAGSGAIGDGD